MISIPLIDRTLAYAGFAGVTELAKPREALVYALATEVIMAACNAATASELGELSASRVSQFVGVALPFLIVGGGSYVARKMGYDFSVEKAFNLSVCHVGFRILLPLVALGTGLSK